MKFKNVFLALILVNFSCSFETDSVKPDSDYTWPSELTSMPIGLKVVNNPEIVYPSLNTKTPQEHTYQLAFETEVSALNENLKIKDCFQK